MTVDRDEDTRSEAILEQLRAEGDPAVRSELSGRYGIHTENAIGISMRRMKAIAQPLAPNHHLAAELWASGLYEARTIAALVDDPAAVDAQQMNSWAADLDNWAIVDTVCFNLFDKSPDAWAMIEPWVNTDGEFTKRAGFALLWALALHDDNATDQGFVDALQLVEKHANDDRHLVTKAQTMALRAIGQKRAAVRPAVVALAIRLVESADPNARRVGRPILKAFDESSSRGA